MEEGNKEKSFDQMVCRTRFAKTETQLQKSLVRNFIHDIDKSEKHREKFDQFVKAYEQIYEKEMKTLIQLEKRKYLLLAKSAIKPYGLANLDKNIQNIIINRSNLTTESSDIIKQKSDKIISSNLQRINGTTEFSTLKKLPTLKNILTRPSSVGRPKTLY